jgi:hypothetical protein
MVTAIAMIAIVAAAVAAAMAEFTAAARRTRYEATSAQLRQMQLAAAVTAKQQLDKGPINPKQRWEIALPSQLLERNAKLTLVADKVSADSASFTSDAAVDRRRMDQTLTFTHSGGKWSASSVALK